MIPPALTELDPWTSVALGALIAVGSLLGEPGTGAGSTELPAFDDKVGLGSDAGGVSCDGCGVDGSLDDLDGATFEEACDDCDADEGAVSLGIDDLVGLGAALSDCGTNVVVADAEGTVGTATVVTAPKVLGGSCNL